MSISEQLPCLADSGSDEGNESFIQGDNANKGQLKMIPCQVCEGIILEGEKKYLKHLQSKEHRSRYFRLMDIETEKPYVELLDDFLRELNPSPAEPDKNT